MSTTRPQFRNMDYAVERQCQRCADWFPSDDEFFIVYRGRLTNTCRACKVERDAEAEARRSKLKLVCNERTAP